MTEKQERMKTAEEIREMIVYMEDGLKQKTHQASDKEVEAGIRCLRWVLNEKKVK